MSVSDKQQRAIEMLLLGKKINDVATAIAVRREVIWDWRKNDAEFIAQYNRERNALVWANEQELLGLFSKAIEVLKKKMGAREALEIIRLMMPDSGHKLAESKQIDVKEIKQRQDKERQEEINKLLREKITSLEDQGYSFEEIAKKAKLIGPDCDVAKAYYEQAKETREMYKSVNSLVH